MSSSPTGVAVVTIVAGRRDHLARQLQGLQRQTRPADELVVVRMDSRDLCLPTRPASRVTVIDLPERERLHLAAARNLGVRAAASAAVVLLDVDCIPGSRLVEACADTLQQVDGLVTGPLRYLAEGQPGGTWTEPQLRAASHQHAARPAPDPGDLVRDDRHELAWTTSLALRRESFERIGGFDERFTGYGGEDTDFAVRAHGAGLGVWWHGDVVAYHQHHPTQNPPVQHLDDIVRNAALFRGIHGWYPMSGWLEEFARRDLVEFDPDAGVLRLR
ncbi:glycosyltransferase family 2 protein [Kineosporia succinea]|uniref:GT2 family glycosyltransferase n=1 Tax=Kineosporia succinea TaxID=84632 RepID=A0ABT9PCK4_9ACTN|nr:galactosyltransferase-related protein [Kineosporia succinea]MDP9830129.1 GT2 family glycosyltransferase [Kineosporia succinea]